MSPCARCVLEKMSKDNDVCRRCDARVQYWTTGAAGIAPPRVKVEEVRFSFAENGAASSRYKGSYRPRPAKPERGTCAFPLCERPKMPGGESEYCHVCYKRLWRRRQKGIPEFATVDEARRIGQKRRREAGR